MIKKLNTAGEMIMCLMVFEIKKRLKMHNNHVTTWRKKEDKKV